METNKEWEDCVKSLTLTTDHKQEIDVLKNENKKLKEQQEQIQKYVINLEQALFYDGAVDNLIPAMKRAIDAGDKVTE